MGKMRNIKLANFCGWFKLLTVCITESKTSQDPVGKESCLGWFTPNVLYELNFSAAAKPHGLI